MLHVVWNDEPRYYLVQADETSIELRRQGEEPASNDLLALDRKRVSASGVWISERVLRLTSIREGGR